MNKIVWWNINTGGAQRVTDRLSSVFERLAECDAAVIGLTEAGRVVQPAIRALARKKGYSVVLGDGLSQRKGVSLLVDNSLTTTQPTTIDALTSQGNIVGQWAGAVVEGLLEAPQVSRRILVSWKDANHAEEDRSEGQGAVCAAGVGALAGVPVADRCC